MVTVSCRGNTPTFDFALWKKKWYLYTSEYGNLVWMIIFMCVLAHATSSMKIYWQICLQMKLSCSQNQKGTDARERRSGCMPANKSVVKEIPARIRINLTESPSRALTVSAVIQYEDGPPLRKQIILCVKIAQTATILAFKQGVVSEPWTDSRRGKPTFVYFAHAAHYYYRNPPYWQPAWSMFWFLVGSSSHWKAFLRVGCHNWRKDPDSCPKLELSKWPNNPHKFQYDAQKRYWHDSVC